jgi:hypothetical protein
MSQTITPGRHSWSTYEKRFHSNLCYRLFLRLAAGVGAITPEKPEFRKLADDVYAYIGKVNDANALIVVTS